MTVLVTGGAGYIGSHAVHELVDAGERVVVLDNLSTGTAQALPSSAVLVRGDCGDAAQVAAIIRAHSVEAIMHFAGSTIVPESLRDPLGYFLNNTANSRTLIATAVDCGVPRFIFSSTAAVYGSDYPTADGTGVRDYIHVSDLARAHRDALRYLRSGGDSVTLNCGYGRGRSVREVIATVRRVTSIDVQVRIAPRRAGDAAAVVAAADRIRTLFGWRPRFDDLDTIVEHALAWERRLADETASVVRPESVAGR